jgi:hypothetical protein
MPNVPIEFTLPLSAVFHYLQSFTPREFGFMYTQTVLLMASSINQLVRRKDEKNYQFALYPWLVGLPLIGIGWIESTLCLKFVKDKLYGHLIYDGYIPVSIAIWYLLCLWDNNKRLSTNSKNKVD